MTESQESKLLLMAKYGMVSKRPTGYQGAGLDAARWDATVKALMRAGLVQRNPLEFGKATSVTITDSGMGYICGLMMDKGMKNPSSVLPDKVIFQGQTYKLIVTCSGVIMPTSNHGNQSFNSPEQASEWLYAMVVEYGAKDVAPADEKAFAKALEQAYRMGWIKE